jgi:hypothetical protein
VLVFFSLWLLLIAKWLYFADNWLQTNPLRPAARRPLLYKGLEI